MTQRIAGDNPQPSVCVLMSLYNGKAYLGQQLESIARQTGVRVHILARDDGSQDGSAGVFEEACLALGLSYELQRGQNLGAWQSFMELLQTAPLGHDLFALSDQDDIWQANKLARAWGKMGSRAGEPVLYFCGRAVTDERLATVEEVYPPAHLGFGNALIQNVIQGAASVMNEAGLALLRSVGAPRSVMMHDWWLYLVFSSLGSLVPDRYVGLLYRQHAGNLVGQRTSRVQQHLHNVRLHFSKSRMRRSVQAAELARLAGARLRAEDRALLTKAVAARGSLLRRLPLALSPKIWRQGRDGWVWRLLILAGRY